MKWVCCSDLWKVEFMNSKIRYLVEENYKQSIEGADCSLLFLFACRKMGREREIEETEI